MVWLGLITIAALTEYFVLGFMVGNARQKYGVAAPATTGDPMFERYYRVHYNTLEALVIFVPAFWLFAFFAYRWMAIVLGLAFIAGRFLYAQGYLADPAKRSTGAFITFGVNGILLLGCAIAMIIRAL
jgi:glutathione S-transferase